jgi:hypothetical protein
MDQMKELVTARQVNSLFLILAVGAPILGLFLGAVIGGRQKNRMKGAWTGLFIGLLGPLNLIAWNIYNLITDHLGLDTVKNLLVNLALFVGAGIFTGLIWGIRVRNAEHNRNVNAQKNKTRSA